MTDSNNYNTLGLDESSSFDQIQEARERLLKECNGDRKCMDAIESAYDSILMERLRLRQEGKIKVPDRIRFAEEATEPSPAPSSDNLTNRWVWLSDFLDTPSREEILLTAGVFAALALVSLAVPSFGLAVGVGCTIYFLNRKERRFWRSLLQTVLWLLVGLTIGILIAQLVSTQGAVTPGGISKIQFEQMLAAIPTLIVLWAVSSFLR